MSDDGKNKWDQIAEQSEEQESLAQTVEQTTLADDLFAKPEVLDESAEASVEAASSAAPSVALQEQVATLQHELEAAQQKMLRVMADADNIKRRAEREAQNAKRFALDKFCRELLPVIDSLERAMLVTSDGQASAEMQGMLEGLQLTMQLFEKSWEKFGIVQLNPEQQAFDPTFHEAVSTVPSADHPANTVLTVVQKGYLLNDRLVRPAMVVVSSAAGGAAAAGSDEPTVDVQA